MQITSIQHNIPKVQAEQNDRWLVSDFSNFYKVSDVFFNKTFRVQTHMPKLKKV